MIPKIGDLVKINPKFIEEYKEKRPEAQQFKETEEYNIYKIKKIEKEMGSVAYMWNRYQGLRIAEDGTYGLFTDLEWTTQVFISARSGGCEKYGGKLKEIMLFVSTTKYCPTYEG